MLIDVHDRILSLSESTTLNNTLPPPNNCHELLIRYAGVVQCSGSLARGMVGLPSLMDAVCVLTPALVSIVTYTQAHAMKLSQQPGSC